MCWGKRNSMHIAVMTLSGIIWASYNGYMATGAFNICCPRDCVSRTAKVERTGLEGCILVGQNKPDLMP